MDPLNLTGSLSFGALNVPNEISKFKITNEFKSYSLHPKFNCFSAELNQRYKQLDILKFQHAVDLTKTHYLYYSSYVKAVRSTMRPISDYPYHQTECAFKESRHHAGIPT